MLQFHNRGNSGDRRGWRFRNAKQVSMSHGGKRHEWRELFQRRPSFPIRRCLRSHAQPIQHVLLWGFSELRRGKPGLRVDQSRINVAERSESRRNGRRSVNMST